MCRSVPHTPARRTRTSTSPGPGVGSGLSTTTRVPGLTHCSARIRPRSTLAFLFVIDNQTVWGTTSQIVFYIKKYVAKNSPGAEASMKSNAVFKRAYNRSLVFLDDYDLDGDIGSEPSWAQRLGVSRTTVRNILQALAAERLIAFEGRRKVLARRPRA